VNALRRAHGLPEVGGLPEVLTHGDHTLYADVPALAPTRGLPPSHRYLGYVPWSAPVAPPAWWERLDPGRPLVYATLGSSGRIGRLPLIVDAAASLGCQVIVATAGRVALEASSPDIYVADYLPGDLAARRASVVVSNGGSTTGYQALAEGKPVLGVAFNLDQYLAMQAIERFGAGLSLRSGALTGRDVARGLERLFGEASFTARARAARDELVRWEGGARFRAFVEEAVGTCAAPRARGARAAT
jgi:UDP:flavonoid glycosyltransferase YjiC (YdhE family)